jgi:hypothetical protein
MTAMTLIEGAKAAGDAGETVLAGIMAMYAERSDVSAP